MEKKHFSEEQIAFEGVVTGVSLPASRETR